MSSFHGFWSLGVLVGSGVSALAAQAGLGAPLQFALVAAVLVATSALACRRLVNDRAVVEADKPPAFALPTRPVLLIGLVGLCAVFADQACTNWSALYIHDQLGGSLGIAALTVTAYSSATASTRLVGDHAVRRFGPVRTVRMAGACATGGAVVVVLAPSVAVGIAGFALLGVGIAVVVPLVFAAAGRVGPHPGRSIAGVTGLAYGGGLATPGVIGGVAAASSFRASFCLVAGLMMAMGLAAGVMRPRAAVTVRP
jgi:MFS family permease